MLLRYTLSRYLRRRTRLVAVAASNLECADNADWLWTPFGQLSNAAAVPSKLLSSPEVASPVRNSRDHSATHSVYDASSKSLSHSKLYVTPSHPSNVSLVNCMCLKLSCVTAKGQGGGVQGFETAVCAAVRRAALWTPVHVYKGCGGVRNLAASHLARRWQAALHPPEEQSGS